MFIFYQVRFSTESSRRFLGKSVVPLVYGTVVEFEGSVVVIWCPVLKRDCVKNGTSLTFDSRYDSPVFIMVIEADKLIANITKKIHR